MPYFPVTGRPQEEKGGKAPVFPVLTAADRDRICRADSGYTKSRGSAFCENPRLFCRQTEGKGGLPAEREPDADDRQTQRITGKNAPFSPPVAGGRRSRLPRRRHETVPVTVSAGAEMGGIAFFVGKVSSVSLISIPYSAVPRKMRRRTEIRLCGSCGSCRGWCAYSAGKCAENNSGQRSRRHRRLPSRSCR